MTFSPDKKLLQHLVCPITLKPLEYDKENQELISKAAGLAYPIKNGIPIMVYDQARPIKN